jgi:lipopolysaccharide biosynthesis glycosyltransferase
MKAYIGYDPREDAAYRVAAKTLRETSGIEAEPLVEERLRAAGLLWRPVDRRGRMHDLVSGSDQSTEFAISRFLVPMLCQSGWALFADCDVVFLRDVGALLPLCQPWQKAVYVVKHRHTPADPWKMDGQAQLAYPRKNWSSVMLFNCDHPAHRRLSLHDVNTRPGRDLHAFYWLHDDEIGELSREWNWLVGVQPKPERPAIAHFTLGGPFTPGWKGAEHDDIWMEAAKP